MVVGIGGTVAAGAAGVVLAVMAVIGGVSAYEGSPTGVSQGTLYDYSNN